MSEITFPVGLGGAYGGAAARIPVLLWVWQLIAQCFCWCALTLHTRNQTQSSSASLYMLVVSNILFSTPAVTLLMVRKFGVKQQTCWGCRERCESLCVKRWWLMLSCTFLHPSCLPSYVPQCPGPQYVISLPLWTKARNVIQAMTVNHQVP